MTMSASLTARRATFEDLLREEHHAELIDGRIVRMSPGELSVMVAFRIGMSLYAWTQAEPGRGKFYAEGMIFRVSGLASKRESFLPDGSYATGPFPAKPMGVYLGAPVFAIEVRSSDGYGPAAEAEAAEKRDDYFAAGTRVVWDVDPLERVVHRYLSTDPANATSFGPDDEADAEPAVPGWRLRVSDVM
jgi:Uma2 family endonuclease